MGGQLVLPYVIELMTEDDLEEVLAIEHASFPRPWSEQAFLTELALSYTCYLVARLRDVGQVVDPPKRVYSWRRPRPAGRGKDASREKGAVVGYAGLQVILDEGHITTVAVHPDFRQRGISELLLLRQFDEARRRGALRLTLEVRISNIAAQNLYEKYGFHVEGRRLRYYGNGEDALIMWTDRLDTASSRARLEILQSQLWERLAGGEDAREEACDSDSGPGDVV